MKAAVIREMTLVDLEERIEAVREELNTLRMEHTITPLNNPMQLRELKRTLARLLTIQTERRRAELEEEKTIKEK